MLAEVLNFEVQRILLLIGAGIALLRSRLGLFLLCANHGLVMTAFMQIEEFGRPKSHSHLPLYLFGDLNIERAKEVTAVFTLILLFSLILPDAANPSRPPLPPMPKPILLMILIYFGIYFFTSSAITEIAYSSSRGEISVTGGLYPLTWSIIIWHLRAKIEKGKLSQGKAIFLVLLGLFFLDYIKGVTGISTGILSTAVFSLIFENNNLHQCAKPISKRASLAFTVLLLATGAAIAWVIRSIRESLFEKGLSESIRLAILKSFGEDSEQGYEESANAVQSACHILMCVSLYDVGISRNWRSFTDTLINTFKPSLLNDLLGLQREIEASWELAEYYAHGGGINIVGELYWNGGFLGIWLGGLFIVLITYLCDILGKKSMWWHAVFLAGAPAYLQAYGYGLSQYLRGFLNGIVYLIPLVFLVNRLSLRPSGEEQEHGKSIELAPLGSFR